MIHNIVFDGDDDAAEDWKRNDDTDPRTDHRIADWDVWLDSNLEHRSRFDGVEFERIIVRFAEPDAFEMEVEGYTLGITSLFQGRETDGGIPDSWNGKLVMYEKRDEAFVYVFPLDRPVPIERSSSTAETLF